jgi:hypothetical protein
MAEAGLPRGLKRLLLYRNSGAGREKSESVRGSLANDPLDWLSLGFRPCFSANENLGADDREDGNERIHPLKMKSYSESGIWRRNKTGGGSG